MSVFLDRVSAVPLNDEDFSFAFESWLSIFVDTLNETLLDIENMLFFKEELSVTSVTAEINGTYIIGNAALTTITLPANAPQGAVVRIIGKGVGGWRLLPGVGQTVEIDSSTAATSVASSSRYDCICVEVVTTNTTWVATSSQTSGFVIV